MKIIDFETVNKKSNKKIDKELNIIHDIINDISPFIDDEIKQLNNELNKKNEKINLLKRDIKLMNEEYKSNKENYKIEKIKNDLLNNLVYLLENYKINDRNMIGNIIKIVNNINKIDIEVLNNQNAKLISYINKK